MTDQQRYDTVNSGSMCSTPNINNLAQDGVLFSNAFCPTPICTPARASCQTGMLPHRHRLIHNTHRNYHIMENLPSGIKTFADHLSSQGYATAYIGKWHVGKTNTPLDHGYQHFGEPQNVASCQWKDGFTDIVSLKTAGKESILAAATAQPVDHTDAFLVANEVCRTIDKYAPRKEPFLIFASTSMPHPPWLCPEKYSAMYDPTCIPRPLSFDEDFSDKPISYLKHKSGHNYCHLSKNWSETATALAHYYGIITLVDDAFGAVLNALETTGTKDNTVVIFTSDHGEMAGAHRLLGKDEILCDELIRIPLVISAPNICHGRTVEKFVTINDIFATCLDLAGLQVDIPPESRSLVPLITGSAETDEFPEEVYLEHHGSLFYNTIRAVRTVDFKYIFRAHEIDELYDLANDPCETQNLINDPGYAHVQKELKIKLLNWMKRTDDPAANGAEQALMERDMNKEYKP